MKNEDKVIETPSNFKEKVETVPQENKTQPMRKIVIEFNNNLIDITKAEVSSNFELQAVLENILRKVVMK